MSSRSFFIWEYHLPKFYTNAFQRGNFIYHRGYDANGKRFQERVKYKPYLFVPDRDGEYRALIGNHPLSKMIFDTIADAREFADKYKEVSNFEYHGMDRWVYPFLNDMYPGTVQYDQSLMRCLFFDVEVCTDGGNPDIRAANKPLTAITMTLGGKYVVLGLKPYDVANKHPELKDVEVEYILCRSEHEILQTFIRIWRDWDPDAVSGWNVEGFDIPYVWKRIAQLWGEEEANKLSPYGTSRKRTYYDRIGRESETVDLHGIANLDYQTLYMKFTLGKKESYSLRFITTEELGCTKLDYEAEGYENLDDLYKRNHQMYIDYNIIDVLRVVQLNAKMKYLDMAYAIAYDAKLNLEDCTASVLLWDVIIHNTLMARNIVVPRQKHTRKMKQIAGAYVKEPRPGTYEWILSFDLNSLYPHLIMQYNISPETFMGVNRDVNPDVVLAENFLLERYVDDDWALAGNGAMFRKDKLGIIPELMFAYYNDRKKFKDKMLETQTLIEQEKLGANDPARLKELKGLEIYYKNVQNAKKVALNSAYGALSNEFFRYYNDDLAEAITLSGQVVIQWAMRHLNDYLNNVLQNETPVDYVIASDTDSLLMTVNDLVLKAFNGKPPEDPTKIVDFLDKVAENKLQGKIDSFYQELKDRMNAYDQKMQMKREKIASRGLWTGAKRYIMFVWDNEGVRYKEPKFVMVGIEAVRSSTPTSMRGWIEEGAKIVLSLDQEKLYSFMEERRAEFDAAQFSDIAMNSSFNNNTNGRLGDKNLYYVVQAGLNYNEQLRIQGLDEKLQRISNGDRVKYSQLKMPNPTREKWFAVPVDRPNDLLGLDKYVDREYLWKTGFLGPMETLGESARLQVVKRATLEDFFF